MRPTLKPVDLAQAMGLGVQACSCFCDWHSSHEPLNGRAALFYLEAPEDGPWIVCRLDFVGLKVWRIQPAFM